MRATIIDVAKAAGVSKATVSRFLNDKSKVNKETADRITEIIKELNYIPNATARNMVLKQTNNLGVLVSSLDSIFWNRILSSIHDYISRIPDPYEIFTLNCNNTVLYNAEKSIRDKIQVLVEQRVAGIILCLRDIKTEDVEYMVSQKMPFVVIQSNSKDERISSINVDNYDASYKAAKYLINLGHKRIAYVTGPGSAVYSIERLEGFKDAMIENHIFNPKMVLHGDNLFTDGYWRMKQILSWNDRPTAVMLASDDMAYGAIKAIDEASLKIPDDMSIIGFDGLREESDMYSMLTPLTTICQPMREIGKSAAELMLKCIENKASGNQETYRVEIKTEFRDYGSCRAVNIDEES